MVRIESGTTSFQLQNNRSVTEKKMRERERQRQRQRQRQRDRERHRQTEAETDKETETDTHRQREIETDRQAERWNRHTCWVLWVLHTRFEKGGNPLTLSVTNFRFFPSSLSLPLSVRPSGPFFFFLIEGSMV